MARRKEPRIPDSVMDELLAGSDPKTAFDTGGLLDALKKALAERALNAETDQHLDAGECGNSRNGYGLVDFCAASEASRTLIPTEGGH